MARPAALGLSALALTLLALTGHAKGRAPAAIKLGVGKLEPIACNNKVRVFQDESSPHIRIGAQARFPVGPTELAKALLHFSRHDDLLPRVAESKVLAVDNNKRELHLYQRLNLPVIDDRDFALHVRWGATKGRLWIRYQVSRKAPARRSGVVRVTLNHGGWDLYPKAGGKETLARYTSTMAMGGSLPMWMAKSGAADELPQMLQAMCHLARPDLPAAKCLK